MTTIRSGLISASTHKDSSRLNSGCPRSFSAGGSGLLISVFLSSGLLIVSSVFSQNQPQVGYAVLRGDEGNPVPEATALFSYRNSDGILVAEAAVQAVSPLTRGRLFVDLDGTQTGVALVNPSDQTIDTSLILRDSQGTEVHRKSISLAPGEHIPRFVNDPQWFPDTPQGFSGSLTFETGQNPVGLAAVTLRQSRNAHGEPLLATLPVVDLAKIGAATRLDRPDSLVFPHVGAGVSGSVILSTQFILINPLDERITGSIRLTSSSGEPLEGELEEVSGSKFGFALEPRGTYRATLTSPSSVVQGYAVVSVASGNTLPAGTAIFQFRDAANNLISEAGVAAGLLTRHARIFVDTVKTETGVAIAIPGDESADITFSLHDRNGLFLDSVEQQVPAMGHFSHFVSDIFTSLPLGFTGLLEIESEVPFVPIALKFTSNRRDDPILTTLPVVESPRIQDPSLLILPQIGSGLGFSTRLILISTSDRSSLAGNVYFFLSNGRELVLPLLGEPVSSFHYSVEAGGVRQFRPGNPSGVAEIRVDSSVLPSREVVVNLGNTRVVHPLIVDTEGEIRDDFPITFGSLSPEIAAVDEFGRITTKQTGFSTLTLTAKGVVKTATISVVDVISGVQGFVGTGIVQDLGGRTYLANPEDQTILLAQDLQNSSVIYAGVDDEPGFRNDTRLNSLFRNPTFLALDQANATLYVSDSQNNAIRRIVSGPLGRVETLAGTGEAGSLDGLVDQATFNDPQGLALDNAGYLWVADSGNHTIRRINLVEGSVETVAGVAKKAGFADGTGSEARFNAPTGIAFEFESFVQRLMREANGEPPPLPKVIVADGGNQVIRRVHADGLVETLGDLTTVSGFGLTTSRETPTSVAVDPAGNIHVSYAETGQVRTLLQTGQVILSAQEGTFDQPAGIIIGEGGHILVADRSQTSREIIFAAPEIERIVPDSISILGGDEVTIHGRNFASDSLVIVAGVVISDVQFQSTRELSFTAPQLPTGLGTVTVQHRGGLDQSVLLVEPVPLAELPDGYITTVAGGSTFSGDGSVATNALIGLPLDAVVDSNGNLYVADSENHRIRRIDAETRIITSVAGNGQAGFSGDNGPALAAALRFPSAVALGRRGDLFIADSQNQRIRRVDADGIISTIAGVGIFGFSGEGGLATEARLSAVNGLAVDADDNLFLSDTFNQRIRKIDSTTGIITTVVGNGEAGFSGDGDTATAASLFEPYGVFVDEAGNLYIADRFNHRIRKVDAQTGIITTVAGTGDNGFSGDEGAATAAALNHPISVAMDAAGNLFVADRDNFRIRKVDAQTGVISTVAGQGTAGFSGDGEAATDARIRRPAGVMVDGSANLYIADSLNRRIRQVDLDQGNITTVAGKGDYEFPGDGSLATTILLRDPESVTIDEAGDVYISDTFHQRVYRLALATGLITAVAGNGQSGYHGDGVLATDTSLSQPVGLSIDRQGTVFIADRDNNRIRRVEAGSGIITTVAGNGVNGFSGDGSQAVAASIGRPEGVAVDDQGNLYIGDTFNHRIRFVQISTGIITTVAGTGNLGDSGDGGLATAAELYLPTAVALDSQGNLYFCDRGNDQIRRVDLATGIITTVAGGMRGFSGDGGAAVTARLNAPNGLAFDSQDNLYISDSVNQRIRIVDAGSGIIRTLVGTGVPGILGDGGPAMESALNYPSGLAIDADDNLFFADLQNDRIRAVHRPSP